MHLSSATKITVFHPQTTSKGFGSKVDFAILKLHTAGHRNRNWPDEVFEYFRY